MTSGSAIAATTIAASPPSTSGGRRRCRDARLLPGLVAAGTVILEYPRLLQELQRAAQVVEVAQIHVGALDVGEGRQLLVGLDALDERVLVGLVGEILLGLLGERELEELLPRLRVGGRVEHAGTGGEDEGPGVAALKVVVGGREVVTALFPDLEEVVVVDEGDVHLARGHALDGAQVVRIDERVVGLDAFEPLPGPVLS